MFNRPYPSLQSRPVCSPVGSPVGTTSSSSDRIGQKEISFDTYL
jgi:hypothetical protein